MKAEQEQPPLDKQYWDDRYLQQRTGWDIGKVSTPLKEYIDQLNDKSIAVLIPGCGNAYEALYLAEKGFTNITLIDISPAIVKEIRQRLNVYADKEIQIICGDFFNLDQEFDLVFEQTFLCALDPQLRERYVLKMADILKKNGKLAGVLFNRFFEGGPPFGGSTEEYKKLFFGSFQIIKMEACYNSIDARNGSELFVILKKT